jgi:MFS family permease
MTRSRAGGHRVTTPRSLVALSHRNFRLLWLGLLASFSGSFMQNAAVLWHVSLLAHPDQRALALGLVGLAKIVPVVVFSMVAGVLADARDRRSLMLYTQAAAAAVALVLAVLTFRGLAVVWPIYALSAVGAAVGAFDLPARQALVPTLVPREHLPNAISLNSIMVQAASVAGPAAAGLVIAAGGVEWAYLLNALSFGSVIVALFMMRDVPTRPPGRGDGADGVSWAAAIEGLRFVFLAPLLRSTMLLDFFVTFFASATALLPLFAQDVLHVGPRGYGWLFAAPAAGAFVTSAILVSMTERIERRGVTLLWAVAGHGLATVAFGLSRSFWLTFACLAITGATDMVSTVIRNIIRQLETPDRLRGRMTSISMVFFQGGPQLGELEAGAVAQWVGAPLSVMTGGLGCLLATAWVAGTTPVVRRYRRGVGGHGSPDASRI